MPLVRADRTRCSFDQDAAHFLIAQVKAHPHQVTICALGPLTNIALALAIELHFAEWTRGIVLMGGSLNPQTYDSESASNPRHEFNFWFDPEAAHKVLRAPWPRIDVTTVDVSVRAPFTQQMVDQIAQSQNPPRVTLPATRSSAITCGMSLPLAHGWIPRSLPASGNCTWMLT
jgi:inosine-uridine nucleoside N-ribohydrolase